MHEIIAIDHTIIILSQTTDHFPNYLYVFFKYL